MELHQEGYAINKDTLSSLLGFPNSFFFSFMINLDCQPNTKILKQDQISLLQNLLSPVKPVHPNNKAILKPIWDEMPMNQINLFNPPKIE